MGSFAKSGILCNINPTCPTSQYEHSIGTRRSKLLAEVKQFPRSTWNGSRSKREDTNQKRGYRSIVKALPDLDLMAVLVQHVEGQRDWISHKTIWHLNDEAIKNVYTMYIMFTCWGCCFFGSMKDPYYDSEEYRGDGGDGTGHWVYEKQEDIEESNRAKLWREELLEEIEQKVGGLQELEEAGKEEELVK